MDFPATRPRAAHPTNIAARLIAFIVFFLAAPASVAAPVTAATNPRENPIAEADIFNWWDEGVITPEQANEMLLMLEENNQSELCLMAEVYAQEPCEGNESLNGDEIDSSRRPSGNQRKRRGAAPSLMPHGFALWKGILDSTGHLQSHREELQISFYRYGLRLGSQNLLSYSEGNYQAHLGQISTREIQSQIPLDTLWGTSLNFPLGKFQLGGMLDTQWTSQLRVGYRFNRSHSLDGALWSSRSVSLQAAFPFGRVAGWWQHSQAEPLLRIQLHGSGKNAGETFSWRTTAYIHGDSVPQFARLSSTILNSRLWGSQTVSLGIPDLANSRITAAARLINPLHSDSISSRFKLDVQSGPKWFRAQGSATCLEARENCRRTDWKSLVNSVLLDRWLLGGSAKVRYIREDGFGNPRLECSFGFMENAGNLVRIILIAPDGNPYSKFQLKNEIKLNGDFLSFILSATFNASRNTELHPYHASATAKVMF